MNGAGTGSCALAGRVDDLLSAYQDEQAFVQAMDDGVSSNTLLNRIVNREGRHEGSEKSSSSVAYSFLQDLHQAGFGHLSVAFEYAMPGSSRRADAIVYSLESNTRQGKRVYLVVEFKGWDDAYIKGFKGFQEKGCQLVSYDESGWGVKHPLDQARNYANYLLNFHSGIAKGAAKRELAAYSCCYIPQLQDKSLAADDTYIKKNFPDNERSDQKTYNQYVLTSPAENDNSFADFFNKFWHPTKVADLEPHPLKSKSEHYDELLEGKYSISAKAREELKGIF